jgi:UDP-2,3-diacylglucosamine hydrolase
MSADRSRIAFVGDVHLDLGDPVVPAFSAMLRALSDSCDTVVLMGDLFNLWIGQDELQQQHQLEVAATLREVRARGVRLHYIEGNRDYRVEGVSSGELFDSVGYDGLALRVPGRSLWAIHGDQMNPADRRNNAWRWVSRSALCWWCFNRLPPLSRLRLVERLEARMRHMNPDFKDSFPQPEIETYAATFARRGHDAIVLGHFHVERQWKLEGGSEVYVLPEWKGSRRHLLADAAGVRFVDSPG